MPLYLIFLCVHAPCSNLLLSYMYVGILNPFARNDRCCIVGALADHAMGGNIFRAPCVGHSSGCFSVCLPYSIPAFYSIYVADRNDIRLRFWLLDHHGWHCYWHVDTVFDRLLVPSPFPCKIHCLDLLNHEMCAYDDVS